MPMPQKLLLDTNVWLDNYMGTRSGSTASRSLISACQRREIPLFIAALSLKDLYYHIGAELKREERASNKTLTASAASAIEEIAWRCALNATENSTIVPVDYSDLTTARFFHQVHSDLEDDFILAAAKRADADYLVTSDRSLIRHAPIAALTPEDALTLVKSAA